MAGITSWLTAGILAIGLALGAGPALSAGSGGGNSSDGAPKPYNPSASKSDPWEQAKVAIRDKDYDKAVPLLKQAVAADPNNADAFNYLGYTHARLDKHEEALAYYQKALAIKPKHLGANEYLGELYLKLGQLEQAEARLEVIDNTCFFGCAEYDMLKAAIADYKSSGKYATRKGI